jgi:hypothetical protein
VITRLVGGEFRHRIVRTQDVLRKAVTLRDQLASSHPDWANTQDARIGAVNRCVNVLTSLLLSFAFIEQCLTKSGWWNANVQGSQSDRPTQLHEYDQFVKIAFTQSLFSIIDSHFRAFLFALDPNACNGSRGEFENVRAALFSRSGYANADDEALIYMFRLVRNAIHNNGVHRPRKPKSDRLSYRGEQFVFTDGQPISFADWEIVLQLAEDVCDLFGRLASNPTIAAVSGTIPS